MFHKNKICQSSEDVSEILWNNDSGGVVCQQRQMSGGFGNNRTERDGCSVGGDVSDTSYQKYLFSYLLGKNFNSSISVLQFCIFSITKHLHN